MGEAFEASLAARRAERNPNRCNPNTEFQLGWEARGVEQERREEGMQNARILGDYLFEHYPTSEPDIAVAALVTIKALEAAKPRTVATVEERDGLPVGTVIMTAAGSIACRFDADVATVFGDERPYGWSRLALPATILYTPSTVGSET